MTGLIESADSPTGFAPTAKVRAIRDELDHPVIDGDGHLVEILPVIVDLVGQIADAGTAKSFTPLLADDVYRRLRLHTCPPTILGLSRPDCGSVDNGVASTHV